MCVCINKGSQVFVVLLFKLKVHFRPPSYCNFCVSSWSKRLSRCLKWKTGTIWETDLSFDWRCLTAYIHLLVCCFINNMTTVWWYMWHSYSLLDESWPEGNTASSSQQSARPRFYLRIRSSFQAPFCSDRTSLLMWVDLLCCTTAAVDLWKQRRRFKLSWRTDGCNSCSF